MDEWSHNDGKHNVVWVKIELKSLIIKAANCCGQNLIKLPSVRGRKHKIRSKL